MTLTPEQRSLQLARLDRRTAHRDQQVAALIQHRSDQAHMPGNASAMERATYWENAAAAAEQRFDTALIAWRTALGDAGDYPDHETAAHVARLAAERTALFNEYARCRDNRDEALAELDTWNRPLPNWP